MLLAFGCSSSPIFRAVAPYLFSPENFVLIYLMIYIQQLAGMYICKYH